MRLHRSQLKRFLFTLVPLFVLLLTCELSLRLFASGPLTFYRAIVGETPLHVAIFRSPGDMKKFQVPLNPHDADAVLGWKNQRHFDKEPYLTTSQRILSAQEIPYERTRTAYRLLVLGDSSSAGLGLGRQYDTWPQVLQRTFPDSIEVVNGSVIGYSSEQARAALISELHKYQPDGLVLYLGNNDRIGSSMTDRRLLDSSAVERNPLVSFENWLVDHYATYVFLKLVFMGARSQAIGAELGEDALRIHRVPLDQFRENVNDMMGWAERSGLDVYVITPPTPLEYPPRILEYNYRRAYDPGWAKRDGCLDDGQAPGELLPALLNTEVTSSRYPKYDFPIAKYADQVLRCFEGRLAEQRQLMHRLIERGVKDAVLYNNLGYVHARSGDDDPALRAFLEAIRLAPTVAAFHYNAGLLYRRLGGEDKALTHLQESIDLDPSAPRIHSTYLLELGRIVAADPLFILVDANRAFRECDNELLFSDHVHPNEKGQQLVAQLVARALWQGSLERICETRNCKPPDLTAVCMNE